METETHVYIAYIWDTYECIYAYIWNMYRYLKEHGRCTNTSLLLSFVTSIFALSKMWYFFQSKITMFGHLKKKLRKSSYNFFPPQKKIIVCQSSRRMFRSGKYLLQTGSGFGMSGSYYKWAKWTKSLLAVMYIYFDHHNDIQTDLKSFKKIGKNWNTFS